MRKIETQTVIRSVAGIMGILSVLIASGVLAAGYKIQVGLPGIRAGDETSFERYVQAIYNLIFGLVVIAALLGLVIGGALYITAGVSSAAKSEAKARITSAIMGILMIALAIILLRTFFGEFGKIVIPFPKLPEIPAVSLPVPSPAPPTPTPTSTPTPPPSGPASHMDCVNYSCVVVFGAGTNKCSSNSNCWRHSKCPTPSSDPPFFCINNTPNCGALPCAGPCQINLPGTCSSGL